MRGLWHTSCDVQRPDDGRHAARWDGVEPVPRIAGPAGRARGFRRVLIPVDGSTQAEAILPVAEEIAGPPDAEVVLLRVVEPLPPGGSMAAAGVVAPDIYFLRELEARRYLTTLAERLSQAGLRVRTLVRLGSPATEIALSAAAEGVDVIAMSTHGRRGFERLLFGSVAEAVLRTARVPLLAVRTAGPGAATTDPTWEVMDR